MPREPSKARRLRRRHGDVLANTHSHANRSGTLSVFHSLCDSVLQEERTEYGASAGWLTGQPLLRAPALKRVRMVELPRNDQDRCQLLPRLIGGVPPIPASEQPAEAV